MINCKKINKMVYGGDYNPEQWSEDVWEEDMRMFRLAHIDIVTLNVFSWAGLQPSEDIYRFEKLDKIMELVRKNGLYVCLATATGAHPAWMAKRYPDILRTASDGTKRKFGGRHNSCPNSPTYQKFSVALAAQLAERYKSYDNIVAWHISNEYGGECYCENCETAFRVWLEKKYGTIEKVNTAWNTAFWGHTFYDWDEIVLPDQRSEHFANDRTMFQGISLDFRRFNSDGMLHNYREEYKAVKAITPDVAITTNLMGFYKPLDYQKWAAYMDFISWDNYPSNEDNYSRIAMNHDLMRGLKKGMPFVLMEQTPSVTNWQQYNALKRPGVMRLWSYQAVAHGADAVMFFQMRRSIGACEKFHGAVIDHCGHENTRVFREITALGEELERIGSVTLGTKTNAKIAIMVDWDNWWALEYSAGPSCELDYLKEVANYYCALREMNYDVDIISVEDTLSQYKVVIAPVLYMVKEDKDESIRSFVSAGGIFVTTFFSGIVQENDLVVLGGYPGKLQDILGIWVEEIDALPAGQTNSFRYGGKEFKSRLLCDIVTLDEAESLSRYEEDFYQGEAVITKHDFGKGQAFYVGTSSDKEFYQLFLQSICSKGNISPIIEVPNGVEVSSRENESCQYIFLLNHTDTLAKVSIPWDCKDIISGVVYAEGELELAGKNVSILEKKLNRGQ